MHKNPHDVMQMNPWEPLLSAAHCATQSSNDQDYQRKSRKLAQQLTQPERDDQGLDDTTPSPKHHT